MKNIIFVWITLIFISPTSVLSDILYCSADKGIGFDVGDAYSESRFEGKRFQLNIDFQNESMIAEKIYLKSGVKCVFSEYSGTMYCINDFGTSLAVHKKTLKFHMSTMTLDPGKSFDDTVIYYGSCEKF